jgi:hypothetical protein
MIINSDSHPNLVRAIHCVQEETGTRILVPVQKIPDRWKVFIDRIDCVIGTLRDNERAPESEPMPAHVKPDAYLDSEFFSFCNGEYHEQSAIANRSFDHALAAVFLNDLFEDWTYTDETAARSPENVARIYRLEWLNTVAAESAGGLTDEQREERDRLDLELT